jgi:hypothetical protein
MWNKAKYFSEIGEEIMGVGAWKGRTQRSKLVCSHIKGLSHEMDLAFDDMYN